MKPSKMDQEELKRETRRVRAASRRRKEAKPHAGDDIKYAAGGMLDVYFASRYLQLRDDVPDEGEAARRAQLSSAWKQRAS